MAVRQGRRRKKVQFRMGLQEWIKDTDELIKAPIERILLSYVAQVEENQKREKEIFDGFDTEWMKQPIRRLIDIPCFSSIVELRVYWEELKLESLTGTGFGPPMQNNKNIDFDENELTVEEYLRHMFQLEREDFETKRKQAVAKLLQKRREIQEPMIEKCKTFLEKKYGVKDEDMKASLLISILNGEFKGKKFERSLSKQMNQLKIGRSEETAYKKGLSLPFDDEISSNHGYIELSTNENGEIIILYRDCGSMNGSFVNGTEIDQHEYVELGDNDILKIGATEMKISRKD